MNAAHDESAPQKIRHSGGQIRQSGGILGANQAFWGPNRKSTHGVHMALRLHRISRADINGPPAPNDTRRHVVIGSKRTKTPSHLNLVKREPLPQSLHPFTADGPVRASYLIPEKYSSQQTGTFTTCWLEACTGSELI